MPRYRPLRKVALVSIVLMGLSAVAAVVQAALMWASYDDMKRFVYGLLSEEEVDRALESFTGTSVLLNLVSYVLLGTGVAFLIWLWQARENTEFLRSPFAPRPVAAPYGERTGPHRHSQGWLVGSWFCPIVQFWYPLQIVQDVVKESEPAEQPGMYQPSGARTLLYTWWATWVGFWVIVVGGGSLAFISFIVWIVRLVDAADAADSSGSYVDIYDLQDFMVRVALFANIGSTVAAVLLLLSGVAIAILMLRVSKWQDSRLAALMAAGPPPPPQYAPRPVDQRSFPTYGQPPPGSQWRG
jgi:hypothetical protein